MENAIIEYHHYMAAKPGSLRYQDEAKAFVADWDSTYKTGENYLLRHLAEQSDYGDGK